MILDLLLQFQSYTVPTYKTMHINELSTLTNTCSTSKCITAQKKYIFLVKVSLRYNFTTDHQPLIPIIPQKRLTSKWAFNLYHCLTNGRSACEQWRISKVRPLLKVMYDPVHNNKQLTARSRDLHATTDFCIQAPWNMSWIE